MRPLYSSGDDATLSLDIDLGAAGCFQNLVHVIIARITIVITIVICAGKTKARKHVLNA